MSESRGEIKGGLRSARAERTYEATAQSVLYAVESAVAELTNWEVADSDDSEPGRLRATRETGAFGFTDDIEVRIEESAGETGSRLIAESASRVGLWDLGQNRRNLKELLQQIDRKL